MKATVGRACPYASELVCAVLALLCWPLPLLTQSPDSFNPGANGSVQAFAIQPDGKILIGGIFDAVAKQPRTNLARLNSDGSLDVAFDPRANSQVSCLALQPDGKILVGGQFTFIGGFPVHRLARLNPDGTADQSFVPVADPLVNSLVLQADGSVVVAGHFTSLNGQPRNYLGRLYADGTLDPTFDPGPDDWVYCLALQPDGAILVGGRFSTLAGQSLPYLGRLNPDGTADMTFNPFPDLWVLSIALQADNEILVGGYFSHLGGFSYGLIGRLNPDGTPDLNWINSASSYVDSLAVQTDGAILAGGGFINLAGQSHPHLGRFNPDSSGDTNFNASANSTVYSLALQSDGKVLAGGIFTTLGGLARTNIGRLTNTGTPTDSLSLNGPMIIWLRSGPGPEVWRTTFEASTNSGSDWLMLGAGQRISGGWQLPVTNLPASANIRARGFVAAGYQSSSSWFVESLSGPPIITSQPASRTNNAGTTATFSVSANASAPFGYRWLANGTNLLNSVRVSGAQSATLTLSNLFGGDASAYSVVVSNAYGTVTSAVATLTVVDPYIATNPASVTTNFGGRATFSAGVIGTAPLSYQWFKNGVSLTNGGNTFGVTTPTLTLTNLTGADAGAFTVAVSNAYSINTSQIATLTVADPFITNQPVGQLASVGQTRTFTVGATGTPPFSYQWRKDSVNLPGATINSLTLTNVQRADAATYDVIVNGPRGSVTSALAVLTINFSTPDAFSAAPDGSVYALAVQPDDKAILGGQFTMVSGISHPGLVRLSGDGTVDNSFNASAGSPLSTARAVYGVAAQGDGHILVAGSFSGLDGANISYLGRLNPDGSLDTNFARVPLVSPGWPFDSSPIEVYALAVQPDAAILAGGYFSVGYAPGILIHSNLIRLNGNGSIDTTFNAYANFIDLTRTAADSVRTLAVQTDGKILVGGAFTALNGQPRRHLGRINADGTLDTAFDPGADTNVLCFAIQPDGKILVGGQFTSLAGTARTNLGRLNPDGTLDAAFTASAKSNVYSLAIQTDGRILVGGSFTSMNGQNRTNLGRLSPDGTLDPIFAPGASGPNGAVLALAVDSAGRILVGGTFTNLGGQAHTNIGRLINTGPATQSLTSDGSTITWLRGGTSPEVSRTTFETQSTSNTWISLGAATNIPGGWQITGLSLPTNAPIRARGIVAGGENNASSWFVETNYGMPAINSEPVSRTNNAGSVASFAVQAVGTASLGYQWLKGGSPLQDGGNISGSQAATLTINLAYGGDADTYSVLISNGFGSLTSQGAILTVVDPYFYTQPTNQYADAGGTVMFSVYARGTTLTYQWRQNGVPLAGATADTLSLTNVQRASVGNYDVIVSSAYGSVTSSVALVTVNLVTADSFNPGADQLINSLAIQPDGKVLVGGAFSSLGSFIARLNTNGSVDTSFHAGADNQVFSLVLPPDGSIVAGGAFNNFNSQIRTNLAHLHPDGTLDMTFDAGIAGDFSSTLYSLALQSDGQILLAGQFQHLGGQPRSNIGRVSPVGALDLVFYPTADTDVISLALQPDGKVLVGGDFSNLNGQSRYIGRLTPDGFSDNFTSSANNAVYAMVVQPDGKVVVGGFFTTLWGQPYGGIGRLNPDGSLDATFNASLSFSVGNNGQVESLALQTDGKILVAGSFTTASGQSRTNLVRLNPDGSVDPLFNPGANGLVFSLALQTDGKIVAGGDFTVLAGQPRSRIGRLNNPDSASQSLSVAGSAITWLRGGSSPEVWRTIFEVSTDGTDWNSLGAGSRIPGGWRLSGVFLPTAGTVRARGYVTGGRYNGSTWYVENTFQLGPPMIIADASFGLRSNRFGFNTRANPGQVVVIEATTNFLFWWPIQTNLVTSSTLFFFSDPETSNFPHRYYRAHIYQGALPPPSVGSGGMIPGSNGFAFNLSAIPGQTVIIEASTDLKTWTSISTNSLNDNTFYFTDHASTNFLSRFYRARVQ